MNFPTHFHDHWRGQRDNCFNRVLRHDFAAKVYKIGVRLDFTCANCDGSVAVVGCIHCNNNSHTPAHYHEQLEQDAAAIHRRHHADSFIAYFQSYSNTYDTMRLQKLYCVTIPGVVGLAIATRPDCLAEETLELLVRRRGSSRQHRRSRLVGEQARHAQRDSVRTDSPRRLARPALYKARISD